MASTSAPTVTLRPAHSSDESFLYELFVSVHPEFDHLPLEGAAKAQLIQMQFSALQQGYASQFPGSSDEIIEQEGHPVGRIWTQRGSVELRGIDLAVLPSAQSRGIGTVILDILQGQAAAEHLPFRISVLKTNVRARSLYERKGFFVINQNDFYFEMEWLPK